MASSGLARFRLSGGHRRPQPDETPVQPASMRLPLLAEAFSRLQSRPRRIISEFAPISHSSMEVFSGMGCRLQLLDFPALFKLLGAAQGAEHFKSLLQTGMSQDPGHQADLVLSWDYLNYLPRGPISLLAQELAPRMKPGALLHALIAYSDPKMPKRPAYFKMQSRESVWVQPELDLSRDAPRYAPNDLLRCLPGFRIEKAVLLKNGYQEYLLQRQDLPAPSSE